MAKGIRIDDSRAPLIFVVYEREVAEEDYIGAMARYRELSREHPRLGYVIDFRRFDPVFASPVMRSKAARLFADNVAVLARSTVCEARIVANPVSRGVLVAFDWITPPKWPTENVGTADDALAFVRRYLGPDVSLP